MALKGCIVTIDAMGCQTEIAKQIKEAEAGYVIAVKGNQSQLEQDMEDTFRFCKPVSEGVGHGRVETCTCVVYADLSHVQQPERWVGLKAIVCVEAVRYLKSSQAEQREKRYYVTSLDADAEKIAFAVRSHWAVENSLHWVSTWHFMRTVAEREQEMQQKTFLSFVGLH